MSSGDEQTKLKYGKLGQIDIMMGYKVLLNDIPT